MSRAASPLIYDHQEFSPPTHFLPEPLRLRLLRQVRERRPDAAVRFSIQRQVLVIARLARPQYGAPKKGSLPPIPPGDRLLSSMRCPAGSTGTRRPPLDCGPQGPCAAAPPLVVCRRPAPG